MIRWHVVLLSALAVSCGPTGDGGVGGADAQDSCAGIDTQNDPLNCGSCGRTCVVPSAEAACSAGECAVGSCDIGFLDEDGDPNNGCEAEDVTVDNSCTTTCGSTGTLDPNDDQICVAPAETCNAIDDNCDGTCDEARPAGCRLGVHRSFGDGHLFTTDLVAAQTAPFSVEAQNYFYIYADASAAIEPVYLCAKAAGKHLVTTDLACEGVGSMVMTLGQWAPADACGSIPLYRAFHPPTNNHFYTVSAAERDNAVAQLGYIAEGIAGYVWNAP